MKLTEDLKNKYKKYKNKLSAAIDAFCGYNDDDIFFNGFNVENDTDSIGIDEIIAHSIQRRITDFSQVRAQNGKVVAMDAEAMDDGETIQMKDAVNNRFNQYDGTNISDSVLSYYATKGFMGYQCYAILGQNKWISKAICMPVVDALRPGFKFTKEEEAIEPSQQMMQQDPTMAANPAMMPPEDNSEQIIKDFDLASEKMNFSKKAEDWLIASRQFGVGYALPIIDDPEYDLSQPFNIDGVKQGTYKGIKIIDPFWMRPVLSGTSTYETCNLDFFEPDYYMTADCKMIHKSHLIKIVFKEVPDILKPTYYYGGMSLTQMIYEQVFLAEQTSKEAPKLVQNKRLLIMSGSLEEAIRNTDRFNNKIQALLEARNNYGVYLTDINENVQQIETSLMEFPELISTQYLLIAGIAEIPYTKFLGTTPKGFNATGEYEMKSYIQMLKSIQEKVMPLIRRHIDLLSMSLYGSLQKISYEFNEIDMPTEQENAQVNSIQTQTLNSLLESGIISPEEARKWLKMDENSGFAWIDDEPPVDPQMMNAMEQADGTEEAGAEGQNPKGESGNQEMVPQQAK